MFSHAINKHEILPGTKSKMPVANKTALDDSNMCIVILDRY